MASARVPVLLFLTAAASLQWADAMSAALYYNDSVAPETCKTDFDALLERLEELSKNCSDRINFTDCCQLKFLGIRRSGVYTVGEKPTYCDMETGDGGWIVIQRRSNDKKNFYKNWNAYRVGFGIVSHDFWYGLDNIHRITAAHTTTQLRVDLQYPNGTWIYAKYKSFKVGSSKDHYTLSVNGYSGSASDSLKYHNNMKFTTHDYDNDRWQVGNCAKSDIGAWWYKACFDSNLNGRYDPGRGILWRQNGILTEFTKVEMKIRPRTWYCQNS